MSTAVRVGHSSATSTSGWEAWNVHNRAAAPAGSAGSDEWDEFEATVVARPLLDGLGNEDEFRTDFDGGFIGMSFRFFDPDTQLWSIYWADTRRLGVLDPPVFGGFDGDTGVFEGEDTLDGPAHPRPLHVVGRDHADAALGAGLLRGRRRRHGRRTG